jgi:hypothetical protein
MSHLTVVRRTEFGAEWEVHLVFASGKSTVVMRGQAESFEHAEKAAARYVAEVEFEARHGKPHSMEPVVFEGFGAVWP